MGIKTMRKWGFFLFNDSTIGELKVTWRTFKGYLCCKTIFCNKVALDVELMNYFFI